MGICYVVIWVYIMEEYGYILCTSMGIYYVAVRVVYKIPYRRAHAWPLGRVRRASKGILHTTVRVYILCRIGYMLCRSVSIYAYGYRAYIM